MCCFASLTYHRWGYKSLLPLFKRLEKIVPGGENFVDKEYHGNDGPWEITIGDGKPEQHAGAAKKFVKACAEVGGIPSGDYNGKNPARASLSQITVDSSNKRSSTSRAFLRLPAKDGKPPMHRSNLTIATDCFIQQVVMRGKHCVGVLLRKNFSADTGSASPVFISSTKETILCGGAVQTPHILLLSGIGPKAELEKVNGIIPIHDLPGVGRNLQDHLFVPLFWPFKKGSNDCVMGSEHLSSKLKLLAEYAIFGTGTATLSACQVCLFANCCCCFVSDYHLFVFENIAGTGIQNDRA